jgi:carboxypeptidase Q
MSYNDSIRKIPAAAITIEDAAMLQRMHDRGQQPRVRLKMTSRTLPDAPSRNIVAEIRGSELPEEIVVFGGHFDSWDAGDGAHDDAGGCVAAWQALRIIKRLNLRPRRTLRLVFWVNEENGLRGGNGYKAAMSDSVRRHVLALEADAGVFRPKGFGFSGSDTLMNILRPIIALLHPIGADTLSRGGGGVDISPLMKAGIPGMGLNVDGSRYFWYHHSDADTVDKIDPGDLNLCAAAIAIVTFTVANLPFPIPK